MEKEVQYRALALLKNGNSDYEYLADVTIRLPVDGTVAQLEDRVKKDLTKELIKSSPDVLHQKLTEKRNI